MSTGPRMFLAIPPVRRLNSISDRVFNLSVHLRSVVHSHYKSVKYSDLHIQSRDASQT